MAAGEEMMRPKRIQERYMLKIAKMMVKELGELLELKQAALSLPKPPRSWALTNGRELVRKLESRRR